MEGGEWGRAEGRRGGGDGLRAVGWVGVHCLSKGRKVSGQPSKPCPPNTPTEPHTPTNKPELTYTHAPPLHRHTPSLPARPLTHPSAHTHLAQVVDEACECKPVVFRVSAANGLCCLEEVCCLREGCVGV